MHLRVRRIGGFWALILFVTLLGNDSLLKGQTNTMPPNATPQNRGQTSGPVAQTTGRTTQSPPLNIPNTGGPGGGSQARPPENPPANPQRPPQVMPNGGQPFSPLTVQEAADLDRLLEFWEKRSSQINSFETTFQHWKYGGDLLNQDAPELSTYGKIQYEAPNKGIYEVIGLVVDGKAKEAPPENRVKYLSTGDKIYEYDFANKHVNIHTIPADQRDGIVGGGPMPFVFGAKAADLKKRYFLRIITPRENAQKGEIWLEAFPRTPEDAEEFKSIQLVLDARDLTPLAFIKTEANGEEKDSYKFIRSTMKIKMKGSLIPGGWDLIIRRPDIDRDWTWAEIEPPQAPTQQIAPLTPAPTAAQPRVATQQQPAQRPVQPPARQEVQEDILYTPPPANTPPSGGNRPQF